MAERNDDIGRSPGEPPYPYRSPSELLIDLARLCVVSFGISAFVVVVVLSLDNLLEPAWTYYRLDLALLWVTVAFVPIIIIVCNRHAFGVGNGSAKHFRECWLMAFNAEITAALVAAVCVLATDEIHGLEAKNNVRIAIAADIRSAAILIERARAAESRGVVRVGAAAPAP